MDISPVSHDVYIVRDRMGYRVDVFARSNRRITGRWFPLYSSAVQFASLYRGRELSVEDRDMFANMIGETVAC